MIDAIENGGDPSEFFAKGEEPLLKSIMSPGLRIIKDLWLRAIIIEVLIVGNWIVH